MPPRPHLVVDISAHGFGHMGMTGPVLDALARLVPALRITLRTTLSREKLEEHVHVPFDHVPQAFDLGMVMRDALHIDAVASHAHYAALHAQWDARLAEAVAGLAALRPTSLLGNVPYLSLAAAARLGIPGVAYGCLHWADVFAAYCGHLPEAAAIETRIRGVYAGAHRFIRAQPAMPMPDLANAVEVGPVGRIGRPQREALRARLALRPAARVALMSMGGVGFDLDVSAWPDLGDWTVLCGMPVRGVHPAVRPLADAGLTYIDALASVDAVIAKLGYATVAEAGLNGIPVLRVPRPGWPEEPTLSAWLEGHGRVVSIAGQDFVAGRLVSALDALARLPAPARPSPGGAEVAARLVAETLVDA